MSAENNSALKWPNSHPPITLIIIDVGVGYWRRTSSTYNMLEGKSLQNDSVIHKKSALLTKLMKPT